MTVKMTDWANGFPLTAGPRTLGVSEAAPETLGFWEGVGRDELLLKWCGACKVHLYPRRIVCPHCGTDDLGWKQVSGQGQVYSFSEIHRAPAKDMEASVPYTVGIVQLAENVHLFGRLYAAAGAEMRVAAPVRMEFRVLERGEKLPVWIATG